MLPKSQFTGKLYQLKTFLHIYFCPAHYCDLSHLKKKKKRTELFMYMLFKCLWYNFNSGVGEGQYSACLGSTKPQAPSPGKNQV